MQNDDFLTLNGIWLFRREIQLLKRVYFSIFEAVEFLSPSQTPHHLWAKEFNVAPANWVLEEAAGYFSLSHLLSRFLTPLSVCLNFLEDVNWKAFSPFCLYILTSEAIFCLFFLFGQLGWEQSVLPPSHSLSCPAPAPVPALRHLYMALPFVIQHRAI